MCEPSFNICLLLGSLIITSSTEESFEPQPKTYINTMVIFWIFFQPHDFVDIHINLFVFPWLCKCKYKAGNL